jgi:ribose transport system substrate-binding protein
MKRAKFLVSLTTNDNDYQQEQATAAEETARRLGVDVEIIYAGNDTINQSQQLLQIIQATANSRPNAIIMEPVGGTALPTVARTAAAAGVGWVVLNHEIDYISEIRSTFNVPAFSLTSDHEEIGRIQGRQFGALLPKGGSILYIQGPSKSSAAKQRTAGMYETKPGNIEIRALKGEWTSESAQRSVQAWLRLSTSVKTSIDLIGCQDDSMALGARKAFQELVDAGDREKWLGLPYTGCDGLPKGGQQWVKDGVLAATVVVPPNTGQAIEMLVQALHKGQKLPEQTMTSAASFPSIEKLALQARKR